MKYHQSIIIYIYIYILYIYSLYSNDFYGIQIIISIFDKQTQTYKQFKCLVDTLSYITWIPSTHLETPNTLHQQLTPYNTFGYSNIKLLSGEISGNFYITNINLTNYIISSQPILLVNKLNISEYTSVPFDGVLGLSKYQHLLHLRNSNISLQENILHQNKSAFIVLKLGGNSPYIKFGEISDNDLPFIRTISSYKFSALQNKTKTKLNINEIKEQIIWLNLYEEGLFVIPLYSVTLLYRDFKGKVVKRELIIDNCLHYGCKASLDTKMFFIYGPVRDVVKFDKLKRKYCGVEEFNMLPDIEFGFVDVNVNRNKKLSNRIVKLILEPKDYMVDNNEENVDGYVRDKEGCVPGFIATESDFDWNFGVLFLSKFLIAYDIEKERIGFVRISQDT